MCIGDYLAKADPIVRALVMHAAAYSSAMGAHSLDEFYQTPLASSMERIHT